jgi:hypothetical protein
MTDERPPTCPRCRSHYVSWAIVLKQQGRIKRVWACKGCETLFTPDRTRWRMPLVMGTLGAVLVFLMHRQAS